MGIAHREFGPSRRIEGRQHLGRRERKRRRRGRSVVARIQQRTASSWTEIQLRQVGEHRVAAAQGAGPFRRYQRGTGLHPVVGTGHLASIGPGLPALRPAVRRVDVARGILAHDVRRAAGRRLVDDVVVHLQRPLAQLDQHRVRRAGTVHQDGVVHQPRASLVAAVQVATDAQRIPRTAGRTVDDDVADQFGILATQVRRPARLLGFAIGADQFDLVQVRALDPVVVDLGALVAHAHQHAAGGAVHVVVAHPEDGVGIRHFVRLHVDRMAAVALAGARDLAVLQRERSRVLVRAEDAVRRAVVHVDVPHGGVVRLAEDARTGAAGDLEALEHDVVRLLELDRVRAAGQQRPRRPGHAAPADRDRTGLGSAVVVAHHDVAGIAGVAVDLDNVAGREVDAVEERGELGVLPTGADVVGGGGRAQRHGGQQPQPEQGFGKMHQLTPASARVPLYPLSFHFHGIGVNALLIRAPDGHCG